jgi:hypothetical protein
MRSQASGVKLNSATPKEALKRKSVPRKNVFINLWRLIKNFDALSDGLAENLVLDSA